LLPLTPYQTQDHVVAEFIKDVPHLTGGASDYEYEPSAEAILDEIVPRFTILQLYQAVLESQASEHSARMVAMRNASDNSDALAEDLTLVYNKARQAGITNEILDIVGGAEALTASIDKIAEDILQMRRMEIVDRPHSTNGGSARPKKQDDLKRIEGIEEKFELALKSAGIDTFEKLAKASEEELLRAVYDAGYKFPPSVHTWTEQAQYAARGDWDGLRKLDVSLIAGRRDKLVEIEGIGPKIASALNAAGINTFAQLASATEEQLRAALSDAGMRYAPSLPTWARQAEFAARGDWDGLKELQASLVAGRNA
jgi:predicted flap endonuclease-1-like 5' DNA nuclease